MINRSPTEEIKGRLSLVDTVGKRVDLRKTGRNLTGLCPFHSEKTPSFVVFPENDSYHCFGCGAHGDIFTFVMRSENLQFVDALKNLAGQAGIQLPSRPQNKSVAERDTRLVGINELAVQFFQARLWGSGGEPALSYLRTRGLSDKTIENAHLGWAPDDWDTLGKHLRERGVNDQDLIEVGLASTRESGGTYDRFRGRIIFPIRNQTGKVLGFGGRNLQDQHPKYLNSPESPIFSKGACLYLIDSALQAIRERDQVVIVEGYMDALVAHQGDHVNVVATLGTALTEQQLRIIKRVTGNLILALDADTAGELATARGLERAREVFGEERVVPTSRGLMRLERQLNANIQIASLPAGLDPAELIGKDLEEWRRLIDQAKPIVEFYIERGLADVDSNSSKEVSKAVRGLLPILSEITDRFEQEKYLQIIAGRTGLARHLIRSELAKTNVRESSRPARRVSRAASQPIEAGAGSTGSQHSTYLIAIILQQPDLVRELPDELDPAELDSPMAQELLAQLLDALAADEWVGLADWQESLEEPLRAFVQEAIERWPADRTPPRARVAEELANTVREIRRRHIGRQIDHVRMALEDSKSAGDELRHSLAKRMNELILVKKTYETAEAQALVFTDMTRSGD